MLCGQISNISNVLALLNEWSRVSAIGCIYGYQREGKMRKVCYVGMARAGQGDNERINYILIGLYNES